MTIETPKPRAKRPARDAACQETVERGLREIIAEAATKGWNAIETISAMEEVLTRLRGAYVEEPRPSDVPSETDPDPSNDWPAAMIDPRPKE